MAIAKRMFPHKPVVDPEVPKHKRGLVRVWRGHHDKSVNVSLSSSSFTRKHKHTQHRSERPMQLEQHRKPTEARSPCHSVYDQCLDDAMMLKTRLHGARSAGPATRFKLAAMKRVVIPPVTIPKSLAEHKGSRDFVGGQRVPFTRGMWQTEKARQYLVLRRLFALPRLPEDRCYLQEA